VSLVSAKVKSQWLKLSLPYKFYRLKPVRLNFGLSMYFDQNFGLRPSLSQSLSPNFEVGLSDSLSEITLVLISVCT